MKGMGRMNKKSNVGLYTGLILVLIGVVFFLDLNNFLPTNYLSQVANLAIGVIIFVMYLNNKKLSSLMVGSFFLLNGGVLIIDRILPGYNYMAGLCLIPGLMFLIAYSVKKYSGYLIPGALLSSIGVYILLISARFIWGFGPVIGMFFIFMAIGFLIIFLSGSNNWAGIPSLIFGCIGVFIIAIGLGALMRHMVFNIVALGIVLIGVGIIIKHFMIDKHDKNEGE